MGKIEIATQWMINLANDDTHGYDQAHRWGPDYDCSSAVITAWENAGQLLWHSYLLTEQRLFLFRMRGGYFFLFCFC